MFEMKKGALAIFMAIIIALAIFAVIGWTRPTTTQETITKLQTLEDLAKGEGGGLTIYGDIDAADWPVFYAPVLANLYPWLHPTYLGLDPGTLTTRSLSEYKAGHVTADVLFGLEPTGVLTLTTGGALMSYNATMPKLMGYNPAWLDPAGYAQPFATDLSLFVYNTNKVNASNLPTTFQGLTDSRWKGQIAIDTPSALGYSSTYFAQLYMLWGNATWTTFMHNFAANQPQLTSGASDSFTKVASGDALIGLAGYSDYVKAVQQQLPLAPLLLEPLVTASWPMAITNGAPHPYTAELFVEWIMSFSGQKAHADRGGGPIFGPARYNQTVFAQLNTMMAQQHVDEVLLNNDDYLTNPGKWSDIFSGFGL